MSEANGLGSLGYGSGLLLEEVGGELRLLAWQHPHRGAAQYVPLSQHTLSRLRELHLAEQLGFRPEE